MSSSDLYGLLASDLSSARAAVEAALCLSLAPHESDWRGGEYFGLGELSDENLLLQRNISDDEEPAEQAFAQYSVLLYVNNTHRSDVVRSLLAEKGTGFTLLKHDEL